MVGKTRKSATPVPDAGSPPLEEQIEILIARCIEAIENEEVRMTISDLIRLRKLRNEMWPEERIVPEVRWIDGWEPVDTLASEKRED